MVEADVLSDIPVADLALFMKAAAEVEEATGAALEECRKVAESLRKYGVLLVRDPRADEGDNARFLDMMERYFEAADSKRDSRPEIMFQEGFTPEFTEVPRHHGGVMGTLTGGNQPLTAQPPKADPKCRFLWRVGPRPSHTDFAQLNTKPVIPEGFPEWEEVMNMWGAKMLAAMTVVSEMAALGFGLPRGVFSDMLNMAPHLLAPTGSDFSRYGQLGTVLAGFHYDLNFLTVHGKSRFPGLFIWLRDGSKRRVAVPDGCLLVQAGKQMEHLTGGHVKAGFHEVAVAPSTVEAIERARAQGRSLWRVSSTFFGHVASDQLLQPLGNFASPHAVAQYPPLLAGDQVTKELQAVKLAGVA